MNNRKDKNNLGEVEVVRVTDIYVDEIQACENQDLASRIIAFSAPVGQASQKIAEQGRLTLKPMPKTEDDKALIAKVRKRLVSLRRLKISLDDL
ncbi:type II toxin-antitoxin system RelB/DinJ family antitoxin [Pseudomonas sp. KNUC1026]|uniref:type II toxin-antitoxin system RelB/DinJ family antitoxin n=1 Tax=Pseudomonas sp. KNUC1026 TaxID=2893890 RepID=UPI001F30613E|nr:type II toxin-antitoxin system RelB/DinJ family antitoxin [Pseudomonas sp. KNUC1026]UFH49203.1 type II toxin-antitoxin system RelB/DinJ family antitoxin [Pseudomonas sp. KNUC1026]